MNRKDPRQQFSAFVSIMRDRCLNPKDPSYEGRLEAAVEYLRGFPGDLPLGDLNELRRETCRYYGLTEERLRHLLESSNGKTRPLANLRHTQTEIDEAVREEREFDELVPSTGYFRDYVEYTKGNAAPIMYHFFAAVAGMAATMNRRCWFPMGAADPIYPPLGIILLGPPAIKKTTACNIVLDLITEAGVTNTYPEKSTPEALIEMLSQKGLAVGIVVVPELSFFLNKAQYNGTLVNDLTRLMDCAKEIKVSTISRGTSTLKEVGVTFLMCSVVNWFVNATPRETFEGGFISRNLLVHQTVSPRFIPRPGPRNEALRLKCINGMLDAHTMMGEMGYEPVAGKMYDEFCYYISTRKPEHEILDSYYQRKPIHATRLAMMLHATIHRDYCMCEECLDRAIKLLDFMERSLPSLMDEMFKTEAGKETGKVLRIIQNFKGPIPHSVLITKMSNSMRAAEVHKIIGSLIEARKIAEVRNQLVGHAYYYTEEDADE